VILAPTRMRGLPRAEAERLACELLTEVDIADQVSAYPAQLSGGQQQGVAIARALRAGVALGLVAGGLVLGGCAGALREEVSRQGAGLVRLQAALEATRQDLLGLRSDVATLREALEGGRDRLAEQAQAVTGARAALDALVARTAATERRVEELADALSGLEVSIGALADQAARLEAAGAGGPLQRPGVRRGGGPVSPEELFDRGMASFRTGELGQAVLDFEELVEQHPGHPLAPSAHFWIGEAYFRTRDFEHAAAQYQRVIDLAPGGERTPDALLRLGLALRSLRREDRARGVWARLVRDFADSEAALRARALLREPGRAGGRSGAAAEPR
jgi:tol-pal system protein YbgF